MGAEFFEVRTTKAVPIATAFREAYDAAAWENGHGGYTGTIAEADGFKVIGECLDNDEIDSWVKRIEDEAEKWGPALCVKIHDPQTGVHAGWLMAGWASS